MRKSSLNTAASSLSAKAMKTLPKVLVYFLFVSILTSGCQHKSDPGSILLSGQLTTPAEDRVHLYFIDTSGFTPVDSVKPKKNGEFSFRFTPDEPGFYLLKSGERQPATLVLHPGDSVFVTLTKNNISNISGGREAAQYGLFSANVQRALKRMDSLAMVIQQSRHSRDFLQIKNRADSTYASIFNNLRYDAVRFLMDYPAFLSQLLVINGKLRQAAFFEAYTDTAWFFYTDSTLRDHYPANRYVINHHKRVAELKAILSEEEKARTKLLAGGKAPLISLPNTGGKMVTPADGGKPYTLLYFWVPSDALSRKSNPELKNLYEKYRSRGLTVYAISLDPSTERWKTAVTMEKLWWTNVNDTLGLRSAVAGDYMINSVPVFVLLDREQRVLDRFISLQALENYLTKVLPDKPG
ncbi:thioredoxin-like domain-containing protein [Lentimicrobium sp.]|uniref:thioredoxin-like domain-containing protein n=1 Tax=Lentimicrobium sp. TaxID=2034841 RepID=UPI002C5E330B|nr:thioredoxin-like domain-containing protein [Lentimicrobium sp.]HOP13855.1 thioredoxin-like domain-containing protein [Lentimicrobium sp.]HPF63343.1 thioredoxin-like domain-containing protein [Lentimicrobium sp.]HPJ62182.1 thioredoxin-like domain-containing protein [Lentimicrobium sp.]HPR25812.1 thioredoxin-like domain-containing protein [Lentimicrobium sp.]